ncbi:MAG: BatA domain-containing protein [bacterium]
MQFKHPEILYALFFLLIPILVHLFQLRRFKKEYFTNVAFLKQVDQQTRKSKQLKKWLILCTRLLLLTCLIIAFAQPYLSKQENLNTKNEVVIYLDNSFSMQAKGPKGNLYLANIQELLSTMDDNSTLTLFTNDRVFRNVTKATLQQDLVGTSYASSQLDYNAAYLKGLSYFSDDNSTLKRLIMVSDFQEYKSLPNIVEEVNNSVHLVQPLPEDNSNIRIDTLMISGNTTNTYDIKALVNTNDIKVPISLYVNDQLQSKSASNENGEALFSIPKNQALNGYLQIDDPNIAFDNTLYFTINTLPKINVLSITEQSDDFLKRIYADDEFSFKSVAYTQLNYNEIVDQDLIVLNGIKNIDTALKNALLEFNRNGKYILIIPSIDINLSSYNQLFKELNTPKYVSLIEEENLITKITFDHPLYRDVFDQKVSNFQYPKVTNYYTTNTSNGILNYQNNQVFLSEANNTYIFSSSLSIQNSNFVNSPLIVPTLYNIGKRAFKLPELYYQIGNKTTFELPINLGQDEIISLKNEETSFIPQQQSISNKVSVETLELPVKSGVYDVLFKEDAIAEVAYNYNRKEGELRYHDLEALTTADSTTSLAETLIQIKNEVESRPLWKWFVIFALLFLITEMLILRFFK